MERYIYLILNVLIFGLPFVFSFEKKVFFVKYWRGLFVGIAVMMLFFLPWDVWFINEEIWNFNNRYLIGGKIANIPIEKVLYLIALPYGAGFIYEIINHHRPYSFLKAIQNKITAGLIFICFILAVVYVDRFYTFTVFSFLSLFLIWHLLLNKSDFLGKFYFMFILFQFPLFFINGTLTGMFTHEPIILYDNAQTMALRILTIPIEEVAYDMLMLLIVITILEMFKVRTMAGALKVT